MATQSQILANRINATKSTGPKSAAGKAQASQNATTHGFYAKAFVVADNEQADFAEIRDNLFDEYAPRDATSEDIFQQILHASWNLFRLRRIENELYATTKNPFADEKLVRQLDGIRRHKGHFERALRTARKLFADQVTDYLLTSAIPPDERHMFSRNVDINSYFKAHSNKWKIYALESFVTRDQLDKERAEHQDRKKVVKKICDIKQPLF
jgi:hypothetical protein